MSQLQIIRATTTAERAGAYYVRIQAMARKHKIPLHLEFDEHDDENTKYIVVVDDYLPIATCRLFPLDEQTIILGRVVVLPEYRHQGIGSLVVREAEHWAKELGFKTSRVESRDNKTGFYEKLGYVANGEQLVSGEIFHCFTMEKEL